MAVDFYAGCLGGCAGVLVGHPFDTVKVRLQTQDSNNKIYRGTYHCISTIIKRESYRGLFKGMSSPMAGLAAVNAIVFGVYGNILRSSSSPNSLLNQFLAGGLAGCVQSVITSPMELAKTRMQLQGQANPNIRIPFWKRPIPLYKNPLDCLYKAFRLEGFRGVFRGFGVTILRDAPAFGVYFAGYEYLTQKITDAKGNVNTLSLLLAGGLAGVISWIVIYPIDVVKSRLQVDGMDGGQKKYSGLWDCVKKSYNTEGYKAFTKGLNSTIIRAFPTNAATFAVFTWVFMICDSPSKIDVDKANGVLIIDKDLQRLTC